MGSQIKDKNIGAMASMNPADIRKEDVSIPILILKQLDRVGYMQTLGFLGKEGPSFESAEKVALSVKNGLRHVESLLYPFLTEEYRERAEPLKKKLRIVKGDSAYFELLGDWADLIIKELGQIDMLPLKETEPVFE